MARLVDNLEILSEDTARESVLEKKKAAIRARKGEEADAVRAISIKKTSAATAPFVDYIQPTVRKVISDAPYNEGSSANAVNTVVVESISYQDMLLRNIPAAKTPSVVKMVDTARRLADVSLDFTISDTRSSEIVITSDTGGEVEMDAIPMDMDPINRVRYPEIVATQAYLDDSIQFNASVEFYPPVLPVQVESMPEYRRDIAQFVTVIVNGEDSPDVYAVLMKTPLTDRDTVAREIPYTFVEF